MTVPHWWLRESLLLTAAAVVATLIFWHTDLDLQVASFFYGISKGMPWAIDSAFWQAIYGSALWLSIAIASTGCLLVIVGCWRKDLKPWRRYGVFMVLGLAIGPGLLVNAVFKDHWGRPRPKALVEFGGTEHYVPPLMFNGAGDGKSFPCGHASAGFSLISLWFIVRDMRRNRGVPLPRQLPSPFLRPPLLHTPLVLALIWGGLLGWVRMMQGGHFLSDVLWSFFITLATHYLLFLFMFIRQGQVH
jgi:membrane-associated PAP2 superfamily phosphatase